MGYWVLIYSCAMIKNFRGLRPIFALALPFQYLLPRYILSSPQGAPGGSSIFGILDLGSYYIKELSKKISELHNKNWLCCLHFSFGICMILMMSALTSFWVMGARNEQLSYHSVVLSHHLTRNVISVPRPLTTAARGITRSLTSAGAARFVLSLNMKSVVVVLGKASSSLLRKGELLDFFNLRLHIRNIYSLKLFAAPLIDWESFTSCFHVLKGISRT